MKYLDVILKAATISLFIVNFSNTISVIAFAAYCLLQQSGISFFTLGNPNDMQNKAQFNKIVDDQIQKMEGQYTIKNIADTISKFSTSENDFRSFYNKLYSYQQYLSFKKAMVENPSKIDSPYEAIAYETLFSHKSELVIPAKYISSIKSLDTTQHKQTDEHSTQVLFNIGFPRHFQIFIERTTLKDLSSITMMFQFGNQYKLRTKMNTLSIQCTITALSLLASYILISNSLLLILSLLSLTLAIYFKRKDDYITLNIGHDPRSIASALFTVNPASNKIQYSFGTIALNVVANALIFSSFVLLGAPYIFNLFPTYTFSSLFLLGLYDRILFLEKRSLFAKDVTTYVSCVDSDNNSTYHASHLKPLGICFPESISEAMRVCHYNTFKLTHLF